jgi:formate hydrogenlyase subunit 3/multisubunit Na+/H+ antiporter MnhD subunit
LHEYLDVLEVLRFLGILMVLVGGVWGAFQRHLGRMLGFAMIFETGRTFLVIGIPEGTQLLFALFFPRIMAFGVWALALSKLKEKSGELRFRAVQGLARRFPIVGAGLILAQFSLVGIPVLAGFPIYLTLWEQLTNFGLWVSLGMVLGSAGLMIGGLRSLAVLVMGPEEISETEDILDRETVYSNGLILIGISAMFVVGLFPQWFLPLLTSISVGFGIQTP